MSPFLIEISLQPYDARESQNLHLLANEVRFAKHLSDGLLRSHPISLPSPGTTSATKSRGLKLSIMEVSNGGLPRVSRTERARRYAQYSGCHPAVAGKGPWFNWKSSTTIRLESLSHDSFRLVFDPVACFESLKHVSILTRGVVRHLGRTLRSAHRPAASPPT
jgi:hypothetical protein